MEKYSTPHSGTSISPVMGLSKSLPSRSCSPRWVSNESRETDEALPLHGGWESAARIRSILGMLHDLNSGNNLTKKVFLEIWGEGDSWEEMCDSITSYPAHLKAPYATEDQVGCWALATTRCVRLLIGLLSG